MMTTKSLFDKNRWVKRLSSEDDGAVAAWFVLFLTVFIGMGALAIDFSYAFMVRHKIQITASSAALAGAAGLATSAAAAEAEALAYANANYADPNILKTVDIDVGYVDMTTVPRGDFNNPPNPGTVPDNAVRVVTRLSEDNSNPLGLFLSGVLGMNQIDVNTTATAVSIPEDTPNACLIALNEDPPSGAGLDMDGNGEILGDGCGICINDTSPCGSGNSGALEHTGNGTIDMGVGGSIIVGGCYADTGNVTADPEPRPDQDTVADGVVLCADPYEEVTTYDMVLQDPDPCGPLAMHGKPIWDGAANFPPLEDITDPRTDPPSTVTGIKIPAGVHCNFPPINGGTPVEFAAGEHYFMNTELSINGVSGAGGFVSSEHDFGPPRDGGTTFIVSGTDISMENATDLYLIAPPDPVDPDKSGMLFFQDPAPGAENPDPPHNINGSTDAILDGVIYLGMEDIEIKGDLSSSQSTGTGCLTILAGTFWLPGGPTINLETSGCGSTTNLPPLSTALRLVD